MKKLSNGNIDKSDLVLKTNEELKKYGKINKQNNAVIRVKDIDTGVIVSLKALRHGLDRRTEVQSQSLLHYGEILENSIKINELTPKNKNASESYILLGVARDKNNKIVLITTVVNKFTNEVESVDLAYSINAKKEPTVPNGTKASANALSLTDSTIKIADVLDFVKSVFPNVLSKDVLMHYGIDRGTSEIESSLIYSTKREQSNLSAYELSEFVSMSDELLEQKRIAEANATELNNLTEFPARKLNQNGISSVVKDLCNTAKAHR